MIRKVLNWFISALALATGVALCLVVLDVDLGLSPKMDILVKAVVIILLMVFAGAAMADAVRDESKNPNRLQHRPQRKPTAKKRRNGRKSTGRNRTIGDDDGHKNQHRRRSDPSRRR